jgi:hypothetical protein
LTENNIYNVDIILSNYKGGKEMIYQVVHTHTNETCPGGSAERAKAFTQWWQSLKKTSGVKVLSAYVAPMDHTFYITLEAEDYATIAKAFGALNSYGTGRTIPVITLEQTLPLAEAGVFRTSK